MALLAAREPMRTLKCEVGHGPMVKARAIERDDVGRTALVVGMTKAALGFGSIGPLAMKALAKCAIACNLLVAIETELRLRTPDQGLVTLFAALLELCMTLGQGPWRHQFLE